MSRERKLGLATRDAYGKALVELGKTHPNVVVLDADLAKSTKSEAFGKAFPGRFFDCGIQEANMAGVAAPIFLSSAMFNLSHPILLTRVRLLLL